MMRTVVYSLCLVLGLSLIGCEGTQTPAPTPSQNVDTVEPATQRSIDFGSDNYNRLWDQAAGAVDEGHVWSPAGNNAVEFYLQIRQGFVVDEDNAQQVKAKRALDKAVSDISPVLSTAIDEALSRGHLQDASRLIRMLAAIDSQWPSLPRQIENVRRIATGTSTN